MITRRTFLANVVAAYFQTHSLCLVKLGAYTHHTIGGHYTTHSFGQVFSSQHTLSIHFKQGRIDWGAFDLSGETLKRIWELDQVDLAKLLPLGKLEWIIESCTLPKERLTFSFGKYKFTLVEVFIR